MAYKSSVNEIEWFYGSHVWDDLSGDLDDWLESVRDDMERADDMIEVARAQGRADAIRRILKWPEITEESITLDKKEGT